MEYKSIETQKRIWPSVASERTDGKLYSYGWGDPESEEAKNMQGRILGNYKKIKEQYLIPHILDKTIIDIGSFDGKWTYYMDSAKRVICGDLDQTAFDKVVKNLEYPNLEFYLCEGDSLKGIEDSSVDFVFSMDSLVRSEVGIIDSYIKEIKRVLSPGGKVCVHLPAQDQHDSWELGFTQIGSGEILEMCQIHGLENARVDKETINHGVLLLVNL